MEEVLHHFCRIHRALAIDALDAGMSVQTNFVAAIHMYQLLPACVPSHPHRVVLCTTVQDASKCDIAREAKQEREQCYEPFKILISVSRHSDHVQISTCV